MKKSILLLLIICIFMSKSACAEKGDNLEWNGVLLEKTDAYTAQQGLKRIKQCTHYYSDPSDGTMEVTKCYPTNEGLIVLFDYIQNDKLYFLFNLYDENGEFVNGYSVSMGGSTGLHRIGLTAINDTILWYDKVWRCVYAFCGNNIDYYQVDSIIDTDESFSTISVIEQTNYSITIENKNGENILVFDYEEQYKAAHPAIGRDEMKERSRLLVCYIILAVLICVMLGEAVYVLSIVYERGTVHIWNLIVDNERKYYRSPFPKLYDKLHLDNDRHIKR